jgi:MFS superfamily sulfate permease-like transporter
MGLGAANLACGLFGGFAVTASDSRTAVNDAMGGRSQLAGVVSAAALALAMLFLSDALSLLPTPALGAILASTAVSLIDLHTLRDLWRISRIEFAFALVSIAGVIVFGVLQGVAIAIGVTLLYLLMRGMKPRDALLGRIPGREGFHKLHRYDKARPLTGLTIYLLQGSLLFFNVDYVKARLEEVIANLAPDTEWLIFNAGAVAHIDTNAVVMLDDIRALAEARGVALVMVELHSEPLDTLVRSGLAAKIGRDRIFDDLEEAVAGFYRRGGPAVSPVS